MNQRRLESIIKSHYKELEKGDTFELLYDGESIAKYEFTEWSIDAKTPIDWLRGCLVFCVLLEGRDINRVSLRFQKKSSVCHSK